MAKMNTARGPMQTSKATPTHEDGPGYSREKKTELYLRATTGFAGEKKSYENGAVHDQQMIELAKDLAVNDWAWMAGFLPWLRQEGNIRTAAIMLAIDAVHARLPQMQGADSTEPYTEPRTNRQVVDAVLQRGDELGEALQYQVNKYGRDIPKPIKRGVADAASRMITQRNVMRYDGKGPMEFADVIELTHPKIRNVTAGDLTIQDPVQGLLYEHLITTRHRGTTPIPGDLQALKARRDLSQMTPADRHAFAAKVKDGDPGRTQMFWNAAAGQWEWVMSWLGDNPRNGKGLSKREQWELVIPSMGYMALIRNLRNFDDAGLKDATASQVAAKISSPEEVKRSRQFPFRFLTAHKNAPSMRWGMALEAAVNHSMGNVPELPGRTLILIDTSGSMTSLMSSGGHQDPRTRPSLMEAAALFAITLAIRNAGNVDIYGFASDVTPPYYVTRNHSVLRMVTTIISQSGRVGHGTEMGKAVAQTYKGQDRVCVFTDMQVTGNRDVTAPVPQEVPFYGFNLAGYEASAVHTGPNRHEMGGLTDHTFRLIPILEAGKDGSWPWEK